MMLVVVPKPCVRFALGDLLRPSHCSLVDCWGRDQCTSELNFWCRKSQALPWLTPAAGAAPDSSHSPGVVTAAPGATDAAADLEQSLSLQLPITSSQQQQPPPLLPAGTQLVNGPNSSPDLNQHYPLGSQQQLSLTNNKPSSSQQLSTSSGGYSPDNEEQKRLLLQYEISKWRSQSGEAPGDPSSSSPATRAVHVGGGGQDGSGGSAGASPNMQPYGPLGASSAAGKPKQPVRRVPLSTPEPFSLWDPPQSAGGATSAGDDGDRGRANSPGDILTQVLPSRLCSHNLQQPEVWFELMSTCCSHQRDVHNLRGSTVVPPSWCAFGSHNAEHQTAFCTTTMPMPGGFPTAWRTRGTRARQPLPPGSRLPRAPCTGPTAPQQHQPACTAGGWHTLCAPSTPQQWLGHATPPHRWGWRRSGQRGAGDTLRVLHHRPRFGRLLRLLQCTGGPSCASRGLPCIRKPLMMVFDAIM
jgi:hypothetical protein